MAISTFCAAVDAYVENLTTARRAVLRRIQRRCRATAAPQRQRSNVKRHISASSRRDPMGLFFERKPRVTAQEMLDCTDPEAMSDNLFDAESRNSAMKREVLQKAMNDHLMIIAAGFALVGLAVVLIIGAGADDAIIDIERAEQPSVAPPPPPPRRCALQCHRQFGKLVAGSCVCECAKGHGGATCALDLCPPVTLVLSLVLLMLASCSC